MTQRLVYLLVIVVCSFSRADEWTFRTPPSTAKRTTVNADWRGFETVELELDVVNAPASAEPVLCSFFFETKQDWWFESSVTLDLRQPGKHSFRLSLKDGTTDWRSARLRRNFGPDTLRWVKCWGVKIFSTQASVGTVNVGDLSFSKDDGGQPTVTPLKLPTPIAGQTVRPAFFINGFRGNPFSGTDVKAQVIVTQGTTEESIPAFFCQEYIRHRPPYQATKLTPYDKPRWQAIWTPRETGSYSLRARVETKHGRLTTDLGTVHVTTGDLPISPGPSEVTTAFKQPYTGIPILRKSRNNWTLPSPEIDARHYIHQQLDWTPAWGNYTGAGEFDQKKAWLLDEWLQSIGSGSPMPLLIFSEDELDEHGTYNWKDNPLNHAKNGPLSTPATFFQTAEGAALIKSRARYFWSRYGHYSGVAGLVILVNRPHDSVVSWVNSMTYELQKEFPDLTMFCNNPGLKNRSKITSLNLTKRWKTDSRLSGYTRLGRDLKAESVQVKGRYPGSTAVLFDQDIQHWCGVDSFAIDIQNSKDAGNEVKVMCSLRVDRDTVFQSPLKWLREADWNRVMFALNDLDAWTCPGNPQRRMNSWDLLNIYDVSLRFFCDRPNAVSLNVRNPHLLYPTVEALATRPSLALALRQPPVTRIEQYERFELDLDINRLFANPYDPDDVALNLHLTTPTGKQLAQPGFFYEPWTLTLKGGREVAVRSGDPHWKLRYTPSEVGTYQWRAAVRCGDETTHISGQFESNAGSGRGFVQHSADNTSLEFSNGDYFYPIGHNLRSPSDRRPGIYQSATLRNADTADRLGTYIYGAWFKKMRMNGENFTRIWMSPWWTGLEWTPRTPGYFGPGYYNQENAARMDRILDLAQKNGIYVNLETANHGMVSTHIDAEWEYHPYNKRNAGGFLDYATQFFTSAKAKKLNRQKMRYTVARWGSSTAVAVWGLMTEVEWVEAYFRGIKWANQIRPRRGMPSPYYAPQYQSSVANWMVSEGQYLSTTDAHPHIVTTHLSNPHHGTEFWQMPGLGIVHNNAYTSFTGMWSKDQFKESNGVADVIREYDRYFGELSQKPRMIGEWGGHHKKNTERQLKAELHTGIWAMHMTNCLGVTGYWWWNLIDAHNLYPHFKALAAFAKNEDRRGKGLTPAKAQLKFPAVENDDVWRRQGLILHNRTSLYAYVFPRAMNMKIGAILPNSSKDTRFTASGDGSLILPSTTRSGMYRVEYWDTLKGEVITDKKITVTKDNQTLPIPSFRTDLAIKMKLLKATATDDTKDFHKPVLIIDEPKEPKKAGILRELWFVNRPSLATVDWSKEPQKTEFLDTFAIPGHKLDHYADRLTAQVTIPKTGSYHFFIASADASRLEISYSGKEENLMKVAYVSYWVRSEQWKQNSSQQSKPVYLKKGATILVRAYHVDRTGGDHLSVGWSMNNGPITVIPGTYCTSTQD